MDKRRYFQKLKSLSYDAFWRQMNIMHTRAYVASMKHYSEAMDIVLTPKQKEQVIAKATEIRETWDGIATVTTESTDREIFREFDEYGYKQS